MSTVPYRHLGQLPKLGSGTSPTPSSPGPESSLFEGPRSLLQAEGAHYSMDSSGARPDCQALRVICALLLLCWVGDKDRV